jgi:hypothetical protein
MTKADYVSITFIFTNGKSSDDIVWIENEMEVKKLNSNIMSIKRMGGLYTAYDGVIDMAHVQSWSFGNIVFDIRDPTNVGNVTKSDTKLRKPSTVLHKPVKGSTNVK